jgi:hypothetical protein
MKNVYISSTDFDKFNTGASTRVWKQLQHRWYEGNFYWHPRGIITLQYSTHPFVYCVSKHVEGAECYQQNAISSCLQNLPYCLLDVFTLAKLLTSDRSNMFWKRAKLHAGAHVQGIWWVFKSFLLPV